MKREDVGLFCLLSAVFLAIIAGGHVQVDALPDKGGALGLLFTAISSLAVGWAFVSEKPPAVKATVVAAASLVVVFDVLIGGAMFTTMRTFVAILVLGGTAWHIGTNRVVQMPTVLYAGFTALLVAALGTSILVSEFRTVSLDVWLNWVLYAAALYLAVATLGRVRGPRLLVATVVLAIALVAVKGILEYGEVRAVEPTYRIFADWNNPNALAGLMVVGIPLALVLAALSDGATRIGAWLAAIAMIVAIGLTQSLGAMLTAPVGVLALAIALVSWRGAKYLLPAVVPLVIGALLFFGAKSLQKPPAVPAQSSPVLSQAASTEQASSTQFRILLWRGGVELLKQQPVGIGVGAYRFNSARSGLTEQTHLTHQSFLQIGVEGGLLAFVGIIGLGVAWIFRMFGGAKSLDLERNVLRAGVFGAVLAATANGFLESNLYYFSAGLLFFVLLATGLQLAADGTSPESLPSSFRGFLVVTCCLLPFIPILWTVYLENAKSRLLTSLDPKNGVDYESARSSLESMAGPDGEAWYLLAWTKRELDQEKLVLYQKAAELAPTTRHLRGLAQAQFDLQQPDKALHTLDDALEYDPNNTRTLLLKMEFERDSGAIEAAKETARRLVAVEDTPYMKTRALAELVPTETYEARIFLADQTNDKDEKVRLLRDALDGFIRYRNTTVPKVLQFERAGLDFVGETRRDAEEKMSLARQTAEKLAEVYSSSGDEESSSKVLALLSGLTVD